MQQLWAVKYGSEIRVSPDKELLRRVCADTLALKNFMGSPLTFIEPADEAGLIVAKAGGYTIIRV